MQRKKLIAELLKTKQKSRHISLLKENTKLLDLDFARKIKDTYYDSWTKEPQKTRNAATALKAMSELVSGDDYKALAFWVSGIADLTEGKLDKAIEDLNNASAIFRRIKQQHNAAQTQVAKLIALAMLGKYDEAIETGKSALKIFEKFGDELAAGKIEMNLSNILSRREKHGQAEKFCLKARNRFRSLGEKEWQVMAENGLANTYAEINDFQKSEKFYVQALEGARLAKMNVTEAEIEASMGNLALFRGRYADALRLLELSRQKYETLEMPHQRAIAELEIADIYAELNLAEEAFEIYEKVSDTLKKLKMRGEEARARANFGRVAAVLENTVLAQRELKKSANLYELEKNPVGAAAVKLTGANLEISQKKYENALKTIKETEKVLNKGENLRQKLSFGWLKAEAFRKLGKRKQAEKLFTEVLAQANRQEQKNITQTSFNSLGKLFRDSGDFKKAENYFKKSVKIIEKLRAPLAAEEFRMAFLSDKLAPFENLAKIYLDRNELEKAFRIIECSRARSLAETLGEDFSGDINGKVSAVLISKLENLREELNWFYSHLNRAEGQAEIGELQREVKKREKLIADVMRQIESTKLRGKEAENLRSGPDVEKLQSCLGAKKTVVEFICFDGRFSAFVLTEKTIEYVDGLANEKEIIELLEGLQFQFGALRYGAGNLKNFEGELKKRADAYLQKLHEKLFAPLEKFTEKRDLVIIPASSLHYVPFQALFDGEKYLIESREISYAPSATVWSYLQKKHGQKSKNALLIGFADERIPLVNNEIKQLKKIFATAKSFTGKNAKFSAFTENAGDFDILHFACHGQFRPENPMFSSLHLADGFVTVRDICSQKLKADLVTLSACETGLSKIFAGDEILGLARGFLSAGANSLVLSLWTVSDEATTRLMKNFYKNLQRGDSISASLAKAQREFIKQDAHPYYWSPFILIGK
ncbi:MAG: CHAT domain-containing tetratricopeptide repeat protein [Pyrinomonadaceae bacterium]